MHSVMKKKEKIFDSSSISLFAVELFFLNSLVKYFVPSFVTKVLPILAVALIFLISKRDALSLKKNVSGFWFFGVVYLCDALWSVAPVKGLMYAVSLFLALIFVNMASKQKIEWDKVLLFLTVVLLIITSFIYIQMITPKITSEITGRLYNNNENYYISAWLKNGWYTGIFPDRAPAAFFSGMLCGVGGFHIIKQKYNKFFGVILYIIGLAAILLTAKRGILLGVLLATVICYLVIRRASGKPILRIVIEAIILFGVGGLIVWNLDIAQITIGRFFDSEDIFTHRLDIYSQMYLQIKKNFVFGTGTASANSILGIGGHNIYLTVLMENGIVGIVLFLFAFGGYLIHSIKILLGMGQSKLIPYAGFSLFIQVFFLIYGMSGNPLYDNYILFFYFGGILIMENVKCIEKQMVHISGQIDLAPELF